MRDIDHCECTHCEGPDGPCAVCMAHNRIEATLAALRLVPRTRGDHRAGCPAGINPQATGIPQGTRRCACHVDPVRTALGEPTTDEELAGR